MEQGNVKNAQADFNAAYALGPQFQDLATYAAAGDILAGDITTADSLLINSYGTTTVNSDILAAVYYQTKNWPRLIALWKARANESGASVQTWFELASAYYVAGDNVDAIRTIKEVIALYPNASSSGAAAISQIEGNTVGK